MTFGTPTQQFLDRLESRREALRARCESFLTEKRAAGIEELRGPDETKFRGMLADLEEMTTQVEEYRANLQRVGTIPAGLGGSAGAMAYGKQWAEQVAEKLHRSMGGGLERRAVVSGSLEIPQLVEVDVIPISSSTASRCGPTPRPPSRTTRSSRPRRSRSSRSRTGRG
jgi:hypothetical protein